MPIVLDNLRSMWHHQTPKFFPGQYQLIGGQTATEPDAVTVTMTGFKKNIPAGAHTVNVYLSGAFSGCEVFDRNLNLVLNIH